MFFESIPEGVNLASHLDTTQPHYIKRLVTKTLNPALAEGVESFAEVTPTVIHNIRSYVTKTDQQFSLTTLVLVVLSPTLTLSWSHLCCIGTLDLTSEHAKTMTDLSDQWQGPIEEVLTSQAQSPNKKAFNILTIDADKLEYGRGLAVLKNMTDITRRTFSWWYKGIAGVSYIVERNPELETQSERLAMHLSLTVQTDSDVTKDDIGPGLRLRTGSPERLTSLLKMWLS